jgi:hypothetical protein
VVVNALRVTLLRERHPTYILPAQNTPDPADLGLARGFARPLLSPVGSNTNTPAALARAGGRSFMYYRSRTQSVPSAARQNKARYGADFGYPKVPKAATGRPRADPHCLRWVVVIAATQRKMTGMRSSGRTVLTAATVGSVIWFAAAVNPSGRHPNLHLLVFVVSRRVDVATRRSSRIRHGVWELRCGKSSIRT